MFQDVYERMKRKNQILFQRDSGCLQELLREMEGASHRTLILWALDCVEAPLVRLESRCPGENRPRFAVERSAEWARGEIKMPVAKRAILDAHAAAKEMEPISAALCHGVAQGISTVHVKSHAPGLPFYELTAIVLERGTAGFEAVAAARISEYRERLLYWVEETPRQERSWAGFIRE